MVVQLCVIFWMVRLHTMTQEMQVVWPPANKLKLYSPFVASCLYGKYWQRKKIPRAQTHPRRIHDQKRRPVNFSFVRPISYSSGLLIKYLSPSLHYLSLLYSQSKSAYQTIDIPVNDILQSWYTNGSYGGCPEKPAQMLNHSYAIMYSMFLQKVQQTRSQFRRQHSRPCTNNNGLSYLN